MHSVTIDKSVNHLVLAQIVHHTQEHNLGKANQTLTVKVMCAQIPVILSSLTSTQLMVLASYVLVVLFQVNQMLTMDLELNASKQDHQVKYLAQAASNTETILEIAKHVPETKLSTSIKMDVLSDQIALLINTMIHVINAKTVKLEPLLTLLQDLANLINQLFRIVDATKNSAQSQIHAYNAQLAKLATTLIEDVK